MKALTKSMSVGAIALALGIGATGCSNPVEDLVEQAVEDASGGDVDINTDDGSVEVETDEGSTQIGGDVELPADFPSVVPLPDGTLTSATVSSGTYTLSYQGVDKPGSDGLRAEIMASGFEEVTVTESEGYLQGGWTGNGYQISIIWSVDDLMIYGAAPL